MNKYISPIMELELINVEDILMSQQAIPDEDEKGENESTGRPINPQSSDVVDYFN